MKNKKETLIRQLHERLMKKFMDRIDESVSGIEVVAEIKADDPGHRGADLETTGQEVDNPDKINVIRHKVAALHDFVILNPDKQKELLEILKQAYEEFKHELRGLVSDDYSVAEPAAQKFKEELLANTKNKLAEKKHTFAD